jgi:hypothetical protein
MKKARRLADGERTATPKPAADAEDDAAAAGLAPRAHRGGLVTARVVARKREKHCLPREYMRSEVALARLRPGFDWYGTPLYKTNGLLNVWKTMLPLALDQADVETDGRPVRPRSGAERSRRWRLAHPARWAASRKAYALSHPAVMRAACKRWRTGKRVERLARQLEELLGSNSLSAPSWSAPFAVVAI